MGASITGVERVLSAQRGMAKKDAGNIAAGLVKCAWILLRVSQKYVPVATGALKASGHVESSGSGFGAKASVVYDTLYAIYVHENLNAYHTPPTSARFLARAVPQVRGAMTAVLKRQINVGV